LEVEIEPLRYSNVTDFANDYLIVSYLSKWKGLATGIDKAAVALDKWILVEDKMRLTNQRLRVGLSSNGAEGAILLARSKIARILGPLDLRRVLSECRWSGGATFDKRRGTPFTQKMSEPFTVTSAARDLFRDVVETDPNWIEAITGFYPSGPVCLLPSRFVTVRGNKFTTVPKSSKTDRCISIEPTGNAFLQQGVGRYFRSRLKLSGIDLRRQEVNQHLALKAQAEGLSTLDLSSASDSISCELVAALLPVDWYLFLNSLRSRETRISGKWRTLEKFSSMGNAFTFELETLIFYGLATAVGKMLEIRLVPSVNTAVYGDDIIVPSPCYDRLVEVLDYCGFAVNQAKSHKDGAFHESCGKHYFNEVDVTPVYQKEVTAGRPEELIRAHNRLSRWSARIYGTFYHRVVLKSMEKYQAACRPLLRKLPRIPYGCAQDDGFVSPEGWLGVYDRNHGYNCDVYLPIPIPLQVSSRPFLAYKLRRPSIKSTDPKGQGSLSTGSAKWRSSSRWVHPWTDKTPRKGAVFVFETFREEENFEDED
jgi:hypothetical protein